MKWEPICGTIGCRQLLESVTAGLAYSAACVGQRMLFASFRPYSLGAPYWSAIQIFEPTLVESRRSSWWLSA